MDNFTLNYIMNIIKFKLALRKSRNKDTCYFKSIDKWTPNNPSIGHCTVTALIIQEYFWGDIVFCNHQDHYWNRLPNGKMVDITKDQMPINTVCCVDQIVTKTDILESPKSIKAKTKERYILLKSRVLVELEMEGSIR